MRIRRCFIVAALTGLLLTGCRAPQPGPPAPPVPEPSDGLRESGPARYARTHPDFAWATADTASFRLYVEAGSGAEARLEAEACAEALGAQAERAVRQCGPTWGVGTWRAASPLLRRLA